MSIVAVQTLGGDKNDNDSIVLHNDITGLVLELTGVQYITIPPGQLHEWHSSLVKTKYEMHLLMHQSHQIFNGVFSVYLIFALAFFQDPGYP